MRIIATKEEIYRHCNPPLRDFLCGYGSRSTGRGGDRSAFVARVEVPFCGPEAALDCSQGMRTVAQGSGGTSDSSEAIMDCDLVSWQAACLNGSRSFNANPNDPGYNQRLYGRVPIDFYCACYDQCTMGQSSVLGLQQRTGATCTPTQLRAGKCREPSSLCR
jgi:hypothetical protein